MTTSLVTVTTQNGSTVVIRQVEAGPPGTNGVGDKSFRYEQSTPSAVWTISHNLNKYPSVVVIDSANDVCEGHIAYPTPNRTVLTFSAPFTGVAHLN